PTRSRPTFHFTLLHIRLLPGALLPPYTTLFRPGPVEEGGHLAPGHIVVRAEPRVRRRIAPSGHTRRRQTIDITLEHAPVVIDELVPTTALVETQPTHQQLRHLTTSHTIVRAEPR